MWLTAKGMAPWQSRLVGETDQHLFLRQTMAALSSLHESQGHGVAGTGLDVGCSVSYSAAVERQIVASSTFRHSIHAISDQNWLAVLAFVVATLVFQFDKVRRQAHAADMLETLVVFRSAAKLGKELHPWLLQSRFIAHIRDQLFQDVPPWDFLAEEAIANLHLINRRGVAVNTEDDPVCRGAIAKLQVWLRLVHCQPRTWMHLIWWPGQISHEYLDLVAQRHPVALLIYLHWCAVMSAAPRQWFLDGWAQAMAGHIAQCLGCEWADATIWAYTRLGVV
jgi:hypothetical protein